MDEVHFTFRNIGTSEAVKTYAREKIQRLQKFLRSPLTADVVLSHERHLQRVEVQLRSGPESFLGQHESEDMYASIDLALDKIDRQVRDAKQSSTTRKRHSSGGISAMSGKRALR